MAKHTYTTSCCKSTAEDKVHSMADNVRAILAIEIGSLTTRVSLIDQVDGESRLIGQTETLTSRELPYQNVFFAVQEATAQLAELTGRQLLHEGNLLMPRTITGDGIDKVVVVTSALEPLRVVVAAIATDVSARSALHAIRGVPNVVLEVITLDDVSHHPTSSVQSWIERQLEKLLPLLPDVIILTGGIEGSAIESMKRLAHLVNLKLSFTEAIKQPLPTVIYAGNTAAASTVHTILSRHSCELISVANVRPTLDQENVTPLRQALLARYARQLTDLPGVQQLADSEKRTLHTIIEAQYVMTRFLAERRQQPVLFTDVGATTTTLIAAAPDHVSAAIHGVCGTAFGVSNLLCEVGPAAIARWLPFAIEEQELIERVLQRTLRPQTMPVTREDCYLDLAIVREALALGMATLRDGQPALTYSYLVVSGGALVHAPHPGMTLLAILDGLQPAYELPGLLLPIHLDSLGLLAVCGGIAAHSADAAVSVFDHDLLTNTPLATCIVLQGGNRFGDPIAEIELITVGGGSEQIQVRNGDLLRLPLPIGRYAQVKVRPRAGVRVGKGAPGEAVESDPAEVHGSLLGLVVDARGRPLALPEDGTERRRLLWSWLRAVGAEHSDSPYPEPVTTLPEMPIPESVIAPAPVVARQRRSWFGRRKQGPTPSEMTLSPAETSPAKTPADDLDELRQKVTKSARRSWFGRRKS